MDKKKVLLASLLVTIFSGYAWGQDQGVSLEVTDTLEQETFSNAPDDEILLNADGEVQKFSVPREYTIQSGDTLWDICLLLLDDPYYWPKLWSLNQYIKNPHLIYPGDRLVFTPGTESSFPNLEIVQEEEEEMIFEVVQGQKKEKKKSTLYKPVKDPFGTTVVEKNVATGQGVSIRLANRFILAPDGVDTLGKITHSGEPKQNLVFGDRIYIDFFRSDYRDTVQPGKKYYVVEKVKKVRNPAGRGKIGTLVKKKAVVQVTKIRKSPRKKSRKVFEGTVLDASDAIQRGDELIEYQEEIVNLVPFYTDDMIKGHIAEADKEQIMISNNDFIFLDIGSEDGLTKGMQLYVVRRGDGLTDISGDKDLPDVAVGRVMVVETWDTTATAYVVTLEQALEIGDRVTSVIE